MLLPQLDVRWSDAGIIGSEGGCDIQIESHHKLTGLERGKMRVGRCASFAGLWERGGV